MNKHLTLVFSSYHSQHLLNKVIKKLPKSYKIIVIENSIDPKVKISLEKKFNNVEVIIPEFNQGLARSYNMGIEKAKTQYVFLNNADLEIENNSIKKLLSCAQKIKKLGIISPTYVNEKVYKNYEIYDLKKKNNSKIFKKFEIIEVDLIDNCFLINKKTIKKNYFDKNYFLFFETFDFCLNLRKKGLKLYVCNKIKFNHFGSKSVHSRYEKIVKFSRAFHYNWSKFYYYKKNYNYFLAFRKIIPNTIKAIKKIIYNVFTLNKKNVVFGLIELYGIACSILNLKSFYRPKK